jgi:hypothetical protein
LGQEKIPWYKVFFGALLDVASATKQYIAAKGLEVEVHAYKKKQNGDISHMQY